MLGAQFGLKDSLIRALDRQEAGTTKRGHRVDTVMAALRYGFVLADTRAEQTAVDTKRRV